MGWASFMEDVRDRLDEDLASIKSTTKRLETIQSPLTTTEKAVLDNLHSLIATVAKARKDLSEVLEMATDPAMDLAIKVSEQGSSIERQQRVISKIQRELEQKARRMINLEDQLAGARKERDDWRRKALSGARG